MHQQSKDIELDEDEAEDLLLSLEQELLRRRFGPPVRLEIEAGVDEALVSKLGSELGIGSENIFHVTAPLNLTSLHKIADLDFEWDVIFLTLYQSTCFYKGTDCLTCLSFFYNHTPL